MRQIEKVVMLSTRVTKTLDRNKERGGKRVGERVSGRDSVLEKRFSVGSFNLEVNTHTK